MEAGHSARPPHPSIQVSTVEPPKTGAGLWQFCLFPDFAKGPLHFTCQQGRPVRRRGDIIPGILLGKGTSMENLLGARASLAWQETKTMTSSPPGLGPGLQPGPTPTLAGLGPVNRPLPGLLGQS